jgi:arginine decarboxylase
MVPKQMFLTQGFGRHKQKLISFEEALRDAQIAQYNLIYVSSILPPKCEIMDRENGLALLKPGQVVFCVMSRVETDEEDRKIAAAVGIARPVDKSHWGYISEHHTFGTAIKEVADYAEDLAATMLASTLGVEFDADDNWDERRQVFEMSGKIVDVDSAAWGTSGKAGLWTTAIAAAVFIL